MSTVDITGFSPLTTKLSLDISKDDFIKRMRFESQEEEERCNLYLELKGVAYHTLLANFIGLDEDEKIDYKKVKNLYVYDKRIRKILYKYLSAFEEGIRGFISNKYSSHVMGVKQLSKAIYRSIVEGSSLSVELENLDFNQLLSISKKLKEQDLIELYGKTTHLAENLYAIKELRNTVSHHRLLFIYEDFNECYFSDGRTGNSLCENIINLVQLSNPFYRDFITRDINESCHDKQDSNFLHSLPTNAIIKI